MNTVATFPHHGPGRGVTRKLLQSLAFGLISIALIGLVAAMLLRQAPAERHRKIPQIALLRLPPPPPPKPEEKPPEPPKIKEVIKIEQPRPVEQQQSEQAPPPGPLGVDAQGSGPGDGFGLVGRPGGRDITTIGTGGGSALSQNLYGTGAARFLAQELARDPKLKSATYTIELLVWIDRDGRFLREQIVRGSGSAELDALIEGGIAQVAPFRQPMPDNLPQPLRIRVKSTDA